jgi:hypothetical protein
MSDLKEYRFTGDHAESLEGGRMIGSGEFTGPIDPTLPQNKQLLDQGLLQEVPNGTFDEFQPDVPDNEPDNDAELTPAEDTEPDPDNPVLAEGNTTPVAPSRDGDPEEGDA